MNTPNNPTGRIYPLELLRRLATLLDEASDAQRPAHLPDLRRAIQPDRLRWRAVPQPARVLPISLLAYSYGKTLLSPGQRIGYLAIPPHHAGPRGDPRRDRQPCRSRAGCALPERRDAARPAPPGSRGPFDIDLFQRKRDLLVNALREIGYEVHRAGRHVLPLPAIAAGGRSGVRGPAESTARACWCFPGRMFETPGFFRISLTATMETIEASLPRFAAAFEQAEPPPGGGGAFVGFGLSRPDGWRSDPEPRQARQPYDAAVSRRWWPWLMRPTRLPSESRKKACHSSIPAGPRASSVWLKITCGSLSILTPRSRSRPPSRARSAPAGRSWMRARRAPAGAACARPGRRAGRAGRSGRWGGAPSRPVVEGRGPVEIGGAQGNLEDVHSSPFVAMLSIRRDAIIWHGRCTDVPHSTIR